MDNERIKEIFADEAFVKNLFALETAAQVQAAMKEKGVDLTEEEIMGIREIVNLVGSGKVTVEQLESGELPEELLEQVSGGVIATLIGVGLGIGISAAVSGLAYGIACAIEAGW